MDKEKVISYLSTGTLPFGNEAKVPLKDIVHTFPYFQLAQVLYAKQLYDDNDTEVAARVKLASAYAPNRKAMYLLFRKPAPKAVEPEVKPVEVKPVVKEEPKITYVYNITEPIKELPKQEPLVVPQPPREPEPVATAPVEIELPKVSEIKEEPKAEPVVETQAPVAAEMPTTPEVKEEPKPESVSETFLEKEILSNIAAIQSEQVLNELPVIEPAKDEKEHILIPPAQHKEADLEGKHSFEYWLKALPEVGAKPVTEKPAKPLKTSDIINSFLANEPRISKPKAEFFSPTKAAKRSVTEDDSIISETLAKILITQGNLQKALKAYETLLLQNPEKRTYFAARIEEIREKIELQKNK